jgi:Uma2 family endonuclease
MVESPVRTTEDEFLALAKDMGHIELVDGEVVTVPTTLRHEDIGMNLTLLLAPVARKHGRLFGSSAGYRMTNGNIRSPDLSFMRSERLPDGQAPETIGDGAPDRAVEILSPSERPGAVYRKLGEYFDAGACQVWLIRPEARTVSIFGTSVDPLVLAEGDTLDGGDLLPGFACPVADIFAAE